MLEKQNFLSNWRTISVYPYATKTEFLKILSYIVVFSLIINTPGLQIARIIIIIMGLGFIISFLGVLQNLTGTTKIYLIRDASYAGPFGPYVNRNHFAGYIGTVILLSIGLLISRFEKVTFSQNVTWRVFLMTFESHLLGNIMFIFALMIMISALCLSLSRGGIISFLITIVIFFIFIGIKRTKTVISKGRGGVILPLDSNLCISAVVWPQSCF